MMFSFTTEQEDLLERYSQYVYRLFTNTERADRGAAESAIANLYSLVGKPPPSFVWCKSPLQAAAFLRDDPQFCIGSLASTSFGLEDSSGLHDLLAFPATPESPDVQILSSPLIDTLRERLMFTLGSTSNDLIHVALDHSIRKTISHSWRFSWRAMLLRLNRSEFSTRLLWALRYKRKEDPAVDFIYYSSTYSVVALDNAPGLALCSFYRDVLNIPLSDDRSHQLDLWAEISHSCYWWWAYKDQCVISDWPIAVHVEMWRGDHEHRLQCETGPALEFADGWKLYVLHGVLVPEEIVETPADKLNPMLVLEEQNVQVRREIVRKIGIERVFESLGAKTIDQWGDYDLVLLDLQDGHRRPYLKMINPSTGQYHLEGVHTDCETVAAALAWRNGTEVPPAVLT